MKKNKLKQVREEKGFTQEFMSKELGISLGAYNMYENGKRQVPFKKAKKISKILNVKMRDIFLPEKFTISKY